MILAYDVTDLNAHIAWTDERGERHTQSITSGKATGFLLPTLDDLENRFGQITRMGVVTGPGSFTGIRVGIATALGLKAARSLEVFGFSKLDLVSDLLENETLVLPGGRGQLIRTRFREGRPDEAPKLVPLDQCDPRDCRSLSPIPGFDCPSLDLNTALRCLQLTERGTPREDDLIPCYVRPADAVAGRSLISKLLNPTEA